MRVDAKPNVLLRPIVSAAFCFALGLGLGVLAWLRDEPELAPPLDDIAEVEVQRELPSGADPNERPQRADTDS